MIKEYENDINYHIKNLVEYFNKNSPLDWGLSISYSLKLQNIADESIKKIFDNHIKDFNNHFIDNFDINDINSFQYITNIYKKINDFINQINSQYQKVENLKLRHELNESDFKLLLSMFEKFKNNSTNNYDFYITKTIQNYIDYFSKVDFFPLVVDRLTYFKNNFDFGDRGHTMQWFITKDKRYTLNPGSEDNIDWRLPYMRDERYGLIKLTKEYIIDWLKNYDKWLWVINDETKIEEINLDKVKMFNHYKDFKDNYIAETFKDYENFNINVLYWKFSYPKYDSGKSDFELEKQFNKLAEIYGKNNFEINNWDSLINFTDNPLIPKLDFDLYKKYTLKPNRTAEVSRPTLYYELLTEQPNYFSIFEQNPISTIKIKSAGIVKQNGVNFDYPKASKLDKYNDVDSSNKEDEETVKNQMKQWLQNWITFLPKYISKNWDSKQIIKALSFYITSNVNYMYFNYSKAFNTDGNNFYNPSSLFEIDRTLQCYGYSQNLSMSLSLLNIPVRIVGGSYYGDPNSLVASGQHAWNEVFVDNKWVSVDLTFADYKDAWSNFNSELNLNEIFLDRDSGTRTMFRLDYSSYITTIIKYLNKDENGNYVHNYVDLPTHYSTDPENELKWENMLPILRKQYKTN
ncbi:transglutaminase family protein [Mycoplasmopsis anatis]|uniref:transglutaminase domain-containing protein n=1 Tax=Mycoplasmopsis anatis TaxID=171279 RepID=UPI001C4DF145|nr:transglutaminase domain-containing protein [Mycoplasmopsis anatis]MBW0594695.1 transglutaminase family protein [Mycoplasmopsis anatis]MBW0595512.1 transglutaminase family protein [Mycoplasmopsis anatis]MBW0598274.1 transglutaminase family protein [Mycoplasmopsis anatis]MBW0599125.1 transglutaminase family protein [Mycoplasmopsis anatis]MBW0601132.1 transglutaminase family protein [Mycoplasmopsis anatis]